MSAPEVNKPNNIEQKKEDLGIRQYPVFDAVINKEESDEVKE
jgi:hypothetical protein